jgi:hypothetical protein
MTIADIPGHSPAIGLEVVEVNLQLDSSGLEIPRRNAP